MSDKKVPLQHSLAHEGEPKVIAEVGGIVDETRVTLCVYGSDLDPDEVTSMMGIQPTAHHRRGDRKGPHSPPAKQGGWFFQIGVRSPQGPQEATAELLGCLPEADEVWRELVARYEVQIRYGIFFTGWNRGFDLDQELMARLARLGVPLDFDLYAEGEE